MRTFFDRLALAWNITKTSGSWKEVMVRVEALGTVLTRLEQFQVPTTAAQDSGGFDHALDGLDAMVRKLDAAPELQTD
jgi:hypothetical protein